jgi:hypothetical protein
LISRWLADRHFYQLAIVHTEADNPEARIAEDGRLAIKLLVDFSLGLLNAVLAAISFIGILWVVRGPLTVAGYSIPGYMVFAWIIYSAITTLSMFLLGRPLVRRVEEKAAGEAQLRYELTRVSRRGRFARSLPVEDRTTVAFRSALIWQALLLGQAGRRTPAGVFRLGSKSGRCGNGENIEDAWVSNLIQPPFGIWPSLRVVPSSGGEHYHVHATSFAAATVSRASQQKFQSLPNIIHDNDGRVATTGHDPALDDPDDTGSR